MESYPNRQDLGLIFINKDPIGFAGEDVKLYRYVQNNPIKGMGSRMGSDFVISLFLFCPPRPDSFPNP